MMELHVRRSGRARTEERADDSARGHGGLEGVGLEPLVQEIGRAHGHELVQHEEVRFAQVAEVPPEPQQSPKVLRGQGCRIRRHHGQDGLHGQRHSIHQLAEPVVRVGIQRGVPVDFAPGLVVIRPANQMVAVGKRGEGALQRKDLEAVPGQLELPDDLGTKEADHVRQNRELEPGEDLLGYRRATHQVPPLQNEHLPTSPGQVRGGREPVMAPADHDGVVHAFSAHSHPLFRGGSKNGVSTTVAEARRR